MFIRLGELITTIKLTHFAWNDEEIAQNDRLKSNEKIRKKLNVSAILNCHTMRMVLEQMLLNIFIYFLYLYTIIDCKWHILNSQMNPIN